MRRLLVLAVIGALGGCGDTTMPFHLDDLSVARDDMAVARDMAMPNDLQMPDLQMPDLHRPSWVTQTVPVPTSLYAIAGAAGEIYVVGDQGVILHTSDEGAHWRRDDTQTTSALFGVWTDGATAIAVGYHGTLLRSTDHGATWQSSLFGSATLLGVGGGHLPSDGGSDAHVWAVGEAGTVLQSIDGGLTWTASATLSNGALRGIWWSPVESFVVGDSGLYRTRDDGASWQNLAYPYAGPRQVWATGSGQILVGHTSLIVRSRDGGLTWTQLVNAAHDVAQFAAFPDGQLWLAAPAGQIAHFVNDFEVPVAADEADVGRPIAAIWGSDPTDVFVVGDNGFIAHRQ